MRTPKAGARAALRRARAAASDVAAVLRRAGLRRTGARVSVLRELEAAGAPLSHAEVAARLASAGFDRATVYRNLVDLVDAGLVRRADLGDHVWRFERVAGAQSQHSSEHPHFVCTDCGNVSCLPAGSVRVTGGRGRPRALSRRALEVRLHGVCDACAR